MKVCNIIIFSILLLNNNNVEGMNKIEMINNNQALQI
jgi:hypothetical protein